MNLCNLFIDGEDRLNWRTNCMVHIHSRYIEMTVDILSVALAEMLRYCASNAASE